MKNFHEIAVESLSKILVYLQFRSFLYRYLADKPRFRAYAKRAGELGHANQNRYSN
jgi:hypothetical protein